MLKVFDDLRPFFEDNYRRINVREYARMAKISPPSASKMLGNYHKEGLLNKEMDRNYIYHLANKDSRIFIELSRAYWLQRFEKAGFVSYLESEYMVPVIILFGSFSKAEIRPGSDIDVAIFSATVKKASVSKFERTLGRKIQLFAFKSQVDVENKDLLKSILSGFMLSGGW
ncbi:TPA: hypothetical protein HA231_01570 [Candidatus Woesearchaeota archaeon]|nr:hypothetical protein [Candidatus Woesearchaeota archaeon]